MWNIALVSSVLVLSGLVESGPIGRGSVDGSTNATSPTVRLDQGVFTGLSEVKTYRWGSIRINSYLGIPYALPPVRFAPPEPVGKSQEVRDATKVMNVCIQQHNEPGGAPESETLVESEDCLGLNVFTPATPGKKPVMVYIHGGAFMFGTAAAPSLDGSNLAARDVVVVVLNYRLNVFGFPGIVDGIPARERNPGLLDQRLALEWVRNNIDRFGGDPAAVTVFGHSAGAMSIDHHLASYSKSTVPFRGAILQSGISDKGPLRLVAAGGNKQHFERLAQALECPSTGLEAVECVKTKPVEAIKQAMTAGSLYFFPAVDEFTVAQHPIRAKRRSEAVDVPVMIGSTANEGTLFVRAFLGPDTNATVAGVLALVSDEPEKAAELAKLYPVGPNKAYASTFDAISALMTDVSFTCPVAEESDRTVNEEVSTWRYQYAATYPNTDLFPGSKAYHSAELPLVFGNPVTGPGVAAASTAQMDMSELMVTAWTNFGRNPESGPGWAPLTGSGRGEKLALFDAGGRQSVKLSKIDRNCELAGNIDVNIPML